MQTDFHELKKRIC